MEHPLYNLCTIVAIQTARGNPRSGARLTRRSTSFLESPYNARWFIPGGRVSTRQLSPLARLRCHRWSLRGREGIEAWSGDTCATPVGMLAENADEYDERQSLEHDHPEKEHDR